MSYPFCKTPRAPHAVALVVAVAAAAWLPPGESAAEPTKARETASPRPVTLGTILETAVRQSPALELARIDVAIADARALEAAGIDDWLLAATASWASSRAEPVEGAVFQTTATDTARLDLDLVRSLPTGGTFGLHGVGQRGQSTAAFESEGEFVPSESEVVRASLLARFDQPLLGGRGRAVARAGRRLAAIEQDAAALDERAEATAIIRELVQAYWELGYAQSDLEIRESSLELARERLRITRAGVEAGAVAPSEVLAVQQVMATREEEVEQAGLGVIRRSIDLRRVAGLPVGANDIDIAAAAPLAIDERALPLDELVSAARAASPEIAALRARGKGAELVVDVTENGLLPRLDASLSFGPTGSSSSTSETLSQIASLDEYEVAASLRYEHAIGRRAARGAHAIARGQLAQSTITIAEAELQVSAAVVEAVRVAKTAARRMSISERAVGLAEQNIEAEIARFELGRSTNFDVLERQDELKQSQLRYARAGVDYLSALAQVEALTDRLLDGYGITVEPR